MLPTLQPWSMPRMEHQCDDQAGCTGWVPCTLHCYTMMQQTTEPIPEHPCTATTGEQFVYLIFCGLIAKCTSN